VIGLIGRVGGCTPLQRELLSLSILLPGCDATMAARLLKRHRAAVGSAAYSLTVLGLLSVDTFGAMHPAPEVTA
jgi:hypothetical protein